MTQEKYIIWSSDLDYDDWMDDLKEQHPELSEQQRMDLMYEINEDHLRDERVNLNIQLSQPILVIADLGLWYGRRMGYKEIPSGNIRDCLYVGRSEESATWYVDKNGDLRCDAGHHDGTNRYLYRVYKSSASEFQIGNLKDKLYRGVATRRDITHITDRLGDRIAQVYGWDLTHPKQNRGEAR